MMARPVKTLCPFSSICRCSWLLRCLFCLALASSPSRVVLRFCSPPYLFSRSLLNFFHVTPGLFFPLFSSCTFFLFLSLILATSLPVFSRPCSLLFSLFHLSKLPFNFSLRLRLCFLLFFALSSIEVEFALTLVCRHSKRLK